MDKEGFVKWLKDKIENDDDYGCYKLLDWMITDLEEKPNFSINKEMFENEYQNYLTVVVNNIIMNNHDKGGDIINLAVEFKNAVELEKKLITKENK